MTLAMVVAIAGTSAAVNSRAPGYTSQRADLHGADDVVLDGVLHVPDGVDARHPAPAVLLAHGLGETFRDTAPLARVLARRGYVVQTWTARGHRGSGGRIDIAGSSGSVADVSRLIDALAARDDVIVDAEGDPRVGIVGISEGGGVAMLAAIDDDRIDAIASIFAWSDLRAALEPNARMDATDDDPGVLKLRWGSELFSSGARGARRVAQCGNVEREACAAWAESGARGQLSSRARRLLAARSPITRVNELRAPTLLVQGQLDSLFGLEQATPIARALQRNDVPHRVEWIRAGHDAPISEPARAHLERAVTSWFDRHLRERDVDIGDPFVVQLGAGRGYGGAQEIPPDSSERRLPLEPHDPADPAGFVRYVAPVAGLPADATSLPGLGDVTAFRSGFATPPGQRAGFLSAPVDDGIEIIGTPRVRLRFAGNVESGIAFVRLVDEAPNGQRITPRGLVAAVRLDGLPPLQDPRGGLAVQVQLPTLAWRLAPGHRLGIEVASTDAGYVAPPQPAIFAVAIDEGPPRGMVVPQVANLARASDGASIWQRWWLPLALAAALASTAFGCAVLGDALIRRRLGAATGDEQDAVIDVRGLTKRFAGGRAVVDDATFTVGRGSIVGLVGPNGAGKTTIIRMLLGLVQPSGGSAALLGRPAGPGAPALGRVGALVEGPGLIPHLSGRIHLQRAWSASGRDLADAGIDEAITAVGLDADADRPVRTWSHGMRQRLGIAQALLGSPDLVVLDEPANGLDPAQIIQLRALILGIAAGGRTVLVSSHQLDELQRVCTDLVLVAEGRVLAAGPLAELIGDHPSLEAAFLHLVGGADA